MTVYDHTDNPTWSNDVDDWGEAFDVGDVVLSPGYASFKTMTMVVEIDPDDPIEGVTRRAAFWEEDEARRYAKALDEDTYDG